MTQSRPSWRAIIRSTHPSGTWERPINSARILASQALVRHCLLSSGHAQFLPRPRPNGASCSRSATLAASKRTVATSRARNKRERLCVCVCLYPDCLRCPARWTASVIISPHPPRRHSGHSTNASAQHIQYAPHSAAAFHVVPRYPKARQRQGKGV